MVQFSTSLRAVVVAGVGFEDSTGSPRLCSGVSRACTGAVWTQVFTTLQRDMCTPFSYLLGLRRFFKTRHHISLQRSPLGQV